MYQRVRRTGKITVAVMTGLVLLGGLSASPAGAFSSGSSGSSGSSLIVVSSEPGSLSSAASSLIGRIFPESEEEFLERISNPLDLNYIPLHPMLQSDLYESVVDLPQPGECPAVTVVAARGSEQNTQIRPARYSLEAPWTSNGFEERNIRMMFGRLEQQHVRDTGESLMKDVHVMGLTDNDYPALLPLSSEGSSVIDFGSSLLAGREAVLTAIDRFEAETGCRSQYLLVGYSQGVLVVDGQEQELIDRGQYVGSVFIANPALHSDDTTVIGRQPSTGGLMSSVAPPPLVHPNRINYCLPGDIVCDRSGEQLSTSGSSIASAQLSTGDIRPGRIHSHYFVVPRDGDEEVMATIAGWISDAIDNPGGASTTGTPADILP